MPHFTTWILVGDTALKFEFSRVSSPSGDKYFVNVMQQQRVLAFFEVRDKGAGNWVVVLPAPEWILEIQNDISKAISEHRQ